MLLLSRPARWVFRIYTLLLVLAAAFLSPPASAFLPLVLLGFHIYLLVSRHDPARWARIRLAADYFTFFAAAVFLEPRMGLLSVLPALPVLGTVSASLSDLSRFTPITAGPGESARRPTKTAVTVGITAVAVLVFSVILGSQVMALCGALVLIYLALSAWLQARSLPPTPIKADPVRLRLLAGSTATVAVKVTLRSKNTGKLGFYSPYDWVNMEPPEVIPQAGQGFTLQLSVTPSLAGPSRLELIVTATDSLGLLKYTYRFVPVMLQVIPRARYAAWFARQYARGTRRGVLPLLASISISQGAVTSPTGIEYYGSRLYQPGDSVRIVDWKHSIKLARLISKEFSELRGEKALLLVNLVAADAEEADRLAYNIIAAGLSLAHDKIPAAVAAYDHEQVRLATAVLTPEALLARTLQLSQQVIVSPNPDRYLGPVDVMQLRSTISRLRQAGTGPSRSLADLLDVEFQSLKNSARQGPVSSALIQALNTVGRQCNIVVMSGRNHDAEALAFNTFELRRRGWGVIEIQTAGRRPTAVP